MGMEFSRNFILACAAFVVLILVANLLNNSGTSTADSATLADLNLGEDDDVRSYTYRSEQMKMKAARSRLQTEARQNSKENEIEQKEEEEHASTEAMSTSSTSAITFSSSSSSEASTTTKRRRTTPPSTQTITQEVEKEEEESNEEEDIITTATTTTVTERPAKRTNVVAKEENSKPDRSQALQGAKRDCQERVEYVPSTPGEIEARKGLVFLDCRGQWGNRLTEYVVARIIAESLNFGLRICPVLLEELAHKGNMFPNVVGIPYDESKMEGLAKEKYKGHAYPVYEMIADKTPRFLHLTGYPFHDYNPIKDYKDKIRNDWLKIDLSCAPWIQFYPGENDVVIHLRGYRGCTEKDDYVYDPSHQFVDPPFEYYDRILQKMKVNGGWDKLWMSALCGMRDKIAVRLQEKYNAQLAPVAEKQPDMADFIFMKSAKRLIMSQSTFSWWAAYLGHATEIHYPLVGDWWGSYPRHMLYVSDEPRYVFHELFNERYFMTYDQIGTPSAYKKKI